MLPSPRDELRSFLAQHQVAPTLGLACGLARFEEFGRIIFNDL